jgi:hypothetical protein
MIFHGDASADEFESGGILQELVVRSQGSKIPPPIRIQPTIGCSTDLRYRVGDVGRFGEIGMTRFMAVIHKLPLHVYPN